MAARSWNERLNNVLIRLVTGTPHQGRFTPRDFEIDDKLKVLKHLLCIRPPEPKLSTDTLNDIDSILKYDADHQLLTPSASIPTIRTTGSGVRIHLWQGDITKITGVTAIVNAANSQLLGCFQPRHKCIDNVIHAAAGPRLRDACHELMRTENDDQLEPVGSAKVTPGFCLPADYVIHTVGPQLRPGTTAPTEEDRQGLARCYKSCLEATEKLPPLKGDERKVLVFCCISTGLFAFPQKMAADLAVKTVFDTLEERQDSSITDIIFDVFRDDDREIYENLLQAQSSLPPPAQQLAEHSSLVPAVEGPVFSTATTWLQEADNLIICAGAGLSAAAGLDYTSAALFNEHFRPFKRLGLSTLYSVFGFQGWPSPRHEWGYYFTHLNVVRNWPTSQIYKPLLEFAETFGQENYHVRTTNADGMFLINGLDEARLSTPQGRYEYLQCYNTCRPDATFPSKPYLEAALPFIDPETLLLTDESKIPRCPHCGGKVVICVRGGHYFNERPFAAGENRWKTFLRDSVRKPGKKTVVLELGVGMNTAGVLRWPNEQLVRTSRGTVKLIRVGLGPSGYMDWDIEEDGNAVGMPGDIATVVPYLLQSRPSMP
ncbi:hypothetical protein N0V93_006843 [Gnomoniopsis smithogilvyi]|uniref:Macro domain-containing protein n=1 Tax=Gnomoniopsis smithogilvyi TaxID=1191159 RepID=A0A9W9CW00_9PEZI|nr:hypothetical protein N0V93_006843 [Gnomoniopsis smithogilvyi]